MKHHSVDRLGKVLHWAGYQVPVASEGCVCKAGDVMTPYRIVGLATTTTEKVTVIIHGPGIEHGGLRREFRSEKEAQAFVDAMNLAFEQGLKKGMHQKTVTAGSQS